ncbi:phosphate signaling complex protein PhoU [Cohnella fermenti]|uniref:Phosphate-specific transport system accessory protein PhoU n=1 Tax=Cohnella fermenti TaxID=2565925 RepID=A0A4S4BL36_9BACL|nr:phosphate signaling complex protein PhoU [Cohnella fermenti]THF75474.1 phosphate signaling complex protein PhoU [Cohnella fermenti]
MVTRREFDIGLEQLRNMLVEMGTKVERALADAMNALETLDTEAARAIVKDDPNINRIEENISDLGAKLIATQQPVAKDLRRILVALKISSDLERMGDLSVDIAKVVIRLDGQPLLKSIGELPQIAFIVRTMIMESIQSYIDENVDLAYKMAKDDDQVDAMYSQFLRETFTYMAEQPKSVAQTMHLSFVGRYIERIADHATNIGESVVFLVVGKRPDLNQ